MRQASADFALTHAAQNAIDQRPCAQPRRAPSHTAHEETLKRFRDPSSRPRALIIVGLFVLGAIGVGVAWQNRPRSRAPQLWLLSTEQASGEVPDLAAARAQAARTWLHSAPAPLREELQESLRTLAPRLERARNPLVVDFDDTPLEHSVKATRAPVQPAVSALSTLAQLLRPGARCVDGVCVHISAQCDEGQRCTPLHQALSEPQARVTLWPLVHALHATCNDARSRDLLLDRLQRRAQRPGSALAWALSAERDGSSEAREAGAQLSKLAAELNAPLPPARRSTWLQALQDAQIQPPLPLPEGLIDTHGALIMPRLDSAEQPQRLLDEVRTELPQQRCAVAPLSQRLDRF